MSAHPFRAVPLRDSLAGPYDTRPAYFLADAGARYILQADTDLLVTTTRAERTGTVYGRHDVDTGTFVQITGQRRWHIHAGNGNRAILHLDTGEGISHIRGVLR